MKLRHSIAVSIVIAIPVVMTFVRLADLALPAELMEPSLASVGAPVLMALHVAGSAVFLVAGLAQFSERSRRAGWHRTLGRWALLGGLVGAGAGLWLTLILPRAEIDGPILFGVRLVASAAWLGAMALAFAHVRRRRFIKHRDWMIRSYALAAATGVQSLVMLPYAVLIEVPSGLASDLGRVAGWLIAIAVGEWIIARLRRRAPTGRAWVA